MVVCESCQKPAANTNMGQKYYALTDDVGNVIGLCRETPADGGPDWDVLMRGGRWRPCAHPSISQADSNIVDISAEDAIKFAQGQPIIINTALPSVPKPDVIG